MTTRTKESADHLADASERVADAKERADDARERGWMADCGDTPDALQRASSLAGLAESLNRPHPRPLDMATSARPLARSRADYARGAPRLEGPTGTGIEELTDQPAPLAFYRFALTSSSGHYAESADGGQLTSNYRASRTMPTRPGRPFSTGLTWPCTTRMATWRSTRHSRAWRARGPSAASPCSPSSMTAPSPGAPSVVWTSTLWACGLRLHPSTPEWRPARPGESSWKRLGLRGGQERAGRGAVGCA